MSYFYLRLQTGGDGIAQAVRVLSRFILVVDLYESNLGELFEVQSNQVCNSEIAPIGCAGACEEDVRDTISDFEPTITSETVIESYPAELEAFGGTRSFEVFI